MENFKTDKNKTCCVTGHRELSLDVEVEKIEKTFIDCIKRGYDTFLVGMAIGFDTICFEILEKIRTEYDIKIIACIPCEGQADKFSQAEKTEYNRMINSADEKIVLSKNYSKWCMTKRNVFMVDNSSLVISYLRKTTGGTAHTVRYALSKEKEIISL